MDRRPWDALAGRQSRPMMKVYFVVPETGRGADVYFRYDGHYGLVRPRDES